MGYLGLGWRTGPHDLDTWLITMVRKSPNSGCSPSRWLLNRGYSLFPHWNDPPSKVRSGMVGRVGWMSLCVEDVEVCFVKV